MPRKQPHSATAPVGAGVPSKSRTRANWRGMRASGSGSVPVRRRPSRYSASNSAGRRSAVRLRSSPNRVTASSIRPCRYTLSMRSWRA